MIWQTGQRVFEWMDSPSHHASISQTLIFGILNVTPDSFSDGGTFVEPEVAVQHAIAMVRAGADIIDVGGESTRPGAQPVCVDEEISRVLPVIKGLRNACEVAISIDTMKAAVAHAALEAGASIINDVSALTADRDMVRVARQSNAGIVLMHMRGKPATMQTGDLASEDIVGDVGNYLEQRIVDLEAEGVQRERICIDPGIGFGKTADQNVELIKHLGRLKNLGRPLLLGVSRKSILGAITGRNVDKREAAGCAAHCVGLLNGASALRVHDVASAYDVVRTTAALTNGMMNR